ncbi:hypothetical protein [Streptomyces sp. NPDC047043]|uniref:hypothetical protein n=1 Tax=Streptomyces sp. NPDC047043 TaxID=3154497 RepID=UPI0033F9C991
MASVMGLLEVREAAARVRVEELQAEADRVLAELAAAEGVLERRLIAKAELAEALAGPGDAADEAVLEVPEPAAEVVKVPVAGSIVPRRREGATAEVLAPDYRRIVELLEVELPEGSEGLMAKEMTDRLGLELVPAKIEGVRSKAKRLVERGWLASSPSGRFTPRVPSAPEAAS